MNFLSCPRHKSTFHLCWECFKTKVKNPAHQVGAEGIWHAFNTRLRNSTRESFIRDLNTKIAENIEDKIALCSQNLPVHIIPEACQLSQISCLNFMSQFHVSSLPLFLIFPRHRDMLTTGLQFKKHFLGTVVTTGVSDSSS